MTDTPIWHEDDDFWQGLAPWWFDREGFEKALGDADALVELLAAAGS